MDNTNKQSSFWELLPLRGLGPIKFLDDRSVIQTYQSELGLVTAERSESLEEQKQNLLETFKLLREFLSEEDIKNTMEGLDTFGDSRENVSRVFMDSGISLEYEENQLLEIFADDRAKELHFQNMPFFSSNPKELIIFISKQLKETPHIHGEEVIFPEHKIFLYSFLIEQAGGTYQQGGKQNRSVCWRNSERVNGVDLAEYHPLNLI